MRYCRCLQKEFTSEEWAWYCRKHPEAGEVVFWHGPFGFNIHDVCMTPRMPVNVSEQSCALIVRTAQSPCGRWSYGLDLTLYEEGACHGCGFIDNPDYGYASENDAIRAALNYTLTRIDKLAKEVSARKPVEWRIHPNSLVGILYKFRKVVEEELRRHVFVQLTLFG